MNHLMDGIRETIARKEERRIAIEDIGRDNIVLIAEFRRFEFFLQGGRHVGIANCGIFSSSPSFFADSLATIPATVMFNDSAMFTIGVRFLRMAVTNSFISGP